MPGHTLMFAPDRMERGANGKLLVFGVAVGGIGNSGAGLVWQDTLWSPLWELGRPTNQLWPVDAPDHRTVLVWRTTEGLGPNLDQTYLVVSELVGSSLAFQDTVVLLTGGLYPYGAAASRRRLWAAGHDRTPPTYVHNTRFFWSENAGVWSEMPFTIPQGDNGISMLAENDTTVVVALGAGGNEQHLRLGRLRGATWEETSPVPGHTYFVLHPTLRRRASGGYWLAWATQDSFIAWSTYRDGKWEPTRYLTFEHSHPSRHSTNWVSTGEDPNEYPVIALGAYNQAGYQRIFVSVPDDTGFTKAEEIPDSDDGIPVVLRDENGDVWLAWYRFFGGMYWQHTYVTATATDFAIGGQTGARQLTWKLTEPAPKSRWAVLRSRNDGPFEAAAHVIAGELPALAWTDSSPPAGVLRYKLRRECLDTRYRWESEEVRWPLRSRRPIHFTQVAAPLVPGQAIELSGAAAGSVRIELFDVQGRRVYERRWQASGSGIDRIPFDAGRPVRSGVYFLRAVDASGSVSAPARIVLLR